MNQQQYFSKHVFVCTNRRSPEDSRGCCWDKGSVHLRNYMKSKVKALEIEGVRINIAGCLDRCEFGPTVVIYPDGIWYSIKNEAEIDLIIHNHILNDEVVEALVLKKGKE